MNAHTYNTFPAVSKGNIGGDLIQTVNARDLHAFLGVGKMFQHWFNDRIATYNFVENQDFTVFAEIGKNPKGGRPSKEYAISIDMAKELCMVERNEKGKQARQYFIECERRAKDPVEALNNPALLKTLLLENVEKVIALEAKIEEDKPKTTFYDSFINQDGLYTLQNAGRALKARPNLFIRHMKEKYLFHQGGNLVPRIAYIQQGIFEVKSTIVEDKARAQTYVTPKGIEYFSTRIPEAIKIGGAA